MVFFYLVTTGWIFDISLFSIINQIQINRLQEEAKRTTQKSNEYRVGNTNNVWEILNTLWGILKTVWEILNVVLNTK